MVMEKIEFVDVTLRDGNQSLWAERMSTGMMLPMASVIDRAGFAGVELLAPSFIGKLVRDLREDPFERIRRVREAGGRTPLRINAGGLNVFGTDQHAMVKLFWRVVAKAGIEEARISDPWNNPEGWKLRAGAAAQAGVRPIINITYSISPRHSNEYYVNATREALKLRPFRICLKDPGGLLTPERTRELVPLMLAEAKEVPIEFHAHCSTGLGPLCLLEAVRLGLRIVNTALPPLADDASLPSLFSVAQNLRSMGFETGIDEESLLPVEAYFTGIAQREGFPVGRPVQYDCAQYVHQVPGGMISNLRNQLKEVGAEHRLPAALEEAVRVRAEFGYPIMVTPLSQFVGSQAAVNVMTGQRYAQVTDQTIRYALGHFGGDVAEHMNPEIRERILNGPRAKELAQIEFKQLSEDQIRNDVGAEGLDEENFLLRYLLRKDDIERMRAVGPAHAYQSGSANGVPNLIEALARSAGSNSISIERPGFRLTLGRRDAP
jgi:oxaloacetate decarboxylase alpha subunit